MSPWTEREIARKLAERDDVEPPAGLLDKIKSEIPPSIQVGPRPVPAAVFAKPTPSRRREWLIAASVATALAGGLLGLRVLDVARLPQDEAAVEAPAQDFSMESQAPPPAAVAPKPEADRQASADAGSVVGSVAPERQEMATSDAREEPSPQNQAVAVPEAAPAPAADPWAALQSNPGVLKDRINVREQAAGGVAGGVVGGVAGGVVGGMVGGVVGGVEGRASRRDEAEWQVDGVVITDMAATPAKPSTGGTAEPNHQPYGDVFFRSHGVNPFVDTDEDRLSTFGLDVDTGSYTVARRFLNDGHLPNPDAIRVEEMVNFFDYGDAPPESGDFAIRAEGAPTPFAGSDYRILRFNVRGREVRAENRKPAVLTFVVDVSGSMQEQNRLGLVKSALGLLLDQLRPADQVGLVVYGSAGRTLLEPTADREAIRQAIGHLQAEGSTNAEQGLSLGYDVAGRAFRGNAINRIVLCSDGVANVGATGPESILQRIGREARRGIELTTLGFGMGNYNDTLMEQLANKGDGRYAYIDSLEEARRVLVEELTGTLQTIAKDSKVQVEFDPRAVASWRLLGYENRDIPDEKFRDDSVDAGEIGAGHSVTALYEVKLRPGVKASQALAAVRLRWHSVEEKRVREAERVLRAGELAPSWERSTRSLRLASLVAEFAEILRGSYWARGSRLEDVAQRLQRVSGEARRHPQVRGHRRAGHPGQQGGPPPASEPPARVEGRRRPSHGPAPGWKQGRAFFFPASPECGILVPGDARHGEKRIAPARDSRGSGACRGRAPGDRALPETGSPGA